MWQGLLSKQALRVLWGGVGNPAEEIPQADKRADGILQARGRVRADTGASEPGMSAEQQGGQHEGNVGRFGEEGEVEGRQGVGLVCFGGYTLHSCKEHSWRVNGAPGAISRDRELGIMPEHFLWHLPRQQKQPQLHEAGRLFLDV